MRNKWITYNRIAIGAMLERINSSLTRRIRVHLATLSAGSSNRAASNTAQKAKQLNYLVYRTILH